MDGTTFETRILANEQRLYRIARAMLRCDQDAGDALQEGIFKAWKHPESLKEEKKFDAWITRIVINECRSIQRGYKRWPLSLHLLPEEGVPPPDPALRDALFHLEEKYRLPVVLHYGEGFSVKETAGLLRLPQSTVKWRLHEGRKRLQNALEEEEM